MPALDREKKERYAALMYHPRRPRSRHRLPTRKRRHPGEQGKGVRSGQILPGGAAAPLPPVSGPPLALVAGRGRLCEQRIHTPLGTMIAMADSAGLRLLLFADSPKLRAQRERCARSLDRPIEDCSNADLKKIEVELAEYFAGERSRFSISLAPVGTPWQLAVWTRLLDQRQGETLSYGDLARALGRPQAARAIGSAVAANPLLIVCPCHRVVPKGGGLGGYAAASWRKQRLLSLERSAGPKRSTGQE